MPESHEQDVINEFRERVARGDLDRVGVIYRVSGGMPGEEHVTEELAIAGTKRARARTDSTTAPPAEASASLDDAEVRELFRELSESAGELLPRDQARFVPDSLVGSITIEVDGRTATLYFLADEEERAAQRRPISRTTAEALDRVSQVERRLLRRSGRGGGRVPER
jgi:hypothetical protein